MIVETMNLLRKLERELSKFNLKTEKYLGVEEAAAMLNISPSRIYRLVNEKRIPYSKPFGKKLLFKKSDIMQIIDSARVEANAN